MQNNRTILIVDDDPSIRNLLSVALTMFGNETVTASKGLEALETLKSTPVDLILLDLMMPVMDGYTFLRHREEDERLRAIPVVITTAFHEKAGGLGVPVLEKPLNFRALLGHVGEHCCC